MENILVVDGMALLFRHYFATAIRKHFMNDASGTPTNGVQGFIRHTATAIKQTDAQHVIVTWDMGRTTFRNDIHPDYKMHRPAPPAELSPQFELVQQLSQKLGFLNIGVNQYEADDVIGTLAKHLKQEYQIKVVSGDRDLLQLLDNGLDVWLMKKGFTEYNKYDVQRFMDEYGLMPQQLIDVKAFMGDTSDGYPGVKGIGEKTAVKLIQAYDNVEGVLENISRLPKGQQDKITMFHDDLMLSRKLAEIHTEVPLDIVHIKKQMPYIMDIDHMHDICAQHDLKIAAAYLKTLQV